MRKKYFILITALLFFFLCETSFACSVCKGGGSQEKLNAYILTTGILGALPMVLGALLFFFIRKINKYAKEH